MLPLCHAGLERVVVALRRGLFELAAADQELPPDGLAVLCAVARQCFVNEYVSGAGEEERPVAEVRIEAWAHPERALRIPHPLEPEGHHARRGERHEVARHDHSGVAMRGALALRSLAVEHGDPVAPLDQVPRRAETCDSGAEDEDVGPHPLTPMGAKSTVGRRVPPP